MALHLSWLTLSASHIPVFHLSDMTLLLILKKNPCATLKISNWVLISFLKWKENDKKFFKHRGRIIRLLAVCLSVYILEWDFCVFTKPELQLREFNRRSNMSLLILHIIVDQISFQGTKNPLKFASLLTCGFVPQLVVAPNQYLYLGGMSSSPLEARTFFWLQFLQCLNRILLTRINSSLNHFKITV